MSRGTYRREARAVCLESLEYRLKIFYIFISVYASVLAPLALPPSAFAVRTDASVHAPARTISTTEVEEVRPPRPSSGSQWLLLLLPSRALSRPRSVLRLGGGWLSAAPAKTSSAPHRRGQRVERHRRAAFLDGGLICRVLHHG